MIDLSKAKSISRETGEANTENPTGADTPAISNTGTDSSAPSPALTAPPSSDSTTGSTKETDEKPSILKGFSSSRAPETPTGQLAAAQGAAKAALRAIDSDAPAAQDKRPISNTEYVFWHLHQCLKTIEKLVPPDSPHGIAVTMHKQQLIDLRNLFVEYDSAIEGLF